MADLKEVYGEYFEPELDDVKRKLRNRLQELYLKHDFLKYSKKFKEMCEFETEPLEPSQEIPWTRYTKMYSLLNGKVMSASEQDKWVNEKKLIKNIEELNTKINNEIGFRNFSIVIPIESNDEVKEYFSQIKDKLIVNFDEEDSYYLISEDEEELKFPEIFNKVKVVKELEVIMPDEPFPPVNKREKNANFKY
jgi:hypothetical protein